MKMSVDTDAFNSETYGVLLSMQIQPPGGSL